LLLRIQNQGTSDGNAYNGETTLGHVMKDTNMPMISNDMADASFESPNRSLMNITTSPASSSFQPHPLCDEPMNVSIDSNGKHLYIYTSLYIPIRQSICSTGIDSVACMCLCNCCYVWQE
jgi:hypothetical protein